ncbi:MAG TPA: hypothetical protein VGZ25_13850, partial [Gemmataceae bacterium]|nr:hypothetical protein [Gemmataceae bacterium]
PDRFIRAAFERILTRKPTAQELADCMSFLEERTISYTNEKAQIANTNDPECKQPAIVPALRAKENLVHVLLNHHDFVTIK